MTDLARPDKPATGRLLVDATSSPAGVLLTVYGEVDLESVPELERELAAADAAAPAQIAVDLDGLSFMDSTGLRVLLLACQKARASGYGFVLRRAPDQARRLFALAGVADMFTIEE